MQLSLMDISAPRVVIIVIHEFESECSIGNLTCELDENYSIISPSKMQLRKEVLQHMTSWSAGIVHIISLVRLLISFPCLLSRAKKSKVMLQNSTLLRILFKKLWFYHCLHIDHSKVTYGHSYTSKSHQMVVKMIKCHWQQLAHEKFTEF